MRHTHTRSLESIRNDMYIYICALHLLWKWQIIPLLMKHNVTYSKFIFSRGYPNKMAPTKIMSLYKTTIMLVDVVVIHFKRTRHSQKHKGGYIAIGAGGSGKKSQWRPFCFSVAYFVSHLLLYLCVRSQRPMAGVRLFHRPNLRGLELCC